MSKKFRDWDTDLEGNWISGTFDLGWTANTAMIRKGGDTSAVKSGHDINFKNKQQGITIRVKNVSIADIPKKDPGKVGKKLEGMLMDLLDPKISSKWQATLQQNKGRGRDDVCCDLKNCDWKTHLPKCHFV